MSKMMLASVLVPWKILVDIIFLVGASSLVSWYFYFYLKRDILGKYIGATIIATLGGLLFFTTLQEPIRYLVMWLLSPKIGETKQLSNVNLIAIFLGAYLAMYTVSMINRNRKRKD